MKRFLRIAAWILGVAVFLAAALLIFIRAKEWKPFAIQSKVLSNRPVPITTDTIKILSWNIGYAGLGKGMDFFYDGGEMVRCGEDETLSNLHNIVEILKEHNDADFILLQEVDFDSKRSYRQNQMDVILGKLDGFNGWHALNYSSFYVPIPVNEPLGKVLSGLVVLSKHTPISVHQIMLPAADLFPVSAFNLKRSMLSLAFMIEGGTRPLYINNIHNSAFVSAEQRDAEVDFIFQYMTSRPLSFTAGDWNMTPSEYTPSQAELTNKYYRTSSISRLLPKSWSIMSDLSTFTMRFMNKPYDSKTSTKSIVDFGITGSEIIPISCKTIDLGFENSDHNPVIFQIVLK